MFFSPIWFIPHFKWNLKISHTLCADMNSMSLSHYNYCQIYYCFKLLNTTHYIKNSKCITFYINTNKRRVDRINITHSVYEVCNPVCQFLHHQQLIHKIYTHNSIFPSITTPQLKNTKWLCSLCNTQCSVDLVHWLPLTSMTYYTVNIYVSAIIWKLFLWSQHNYAWLF